MGASSNTLMRALQASTPKTKLQHRAHANFASKQNKLQLAGVICTILHSHVVPRCSNRGMVSAARPSTVRSGSHQGTGKANKSSIFKHLGTSADADCLCTRGGARPRLQTAAHGTSFAQHKSALQASACFATQMLECNGQHPFDIKPCQELVDHSEWKDGSVCR